MAAAGPTTLLGTVIEPLATRVSNRCVPKDGCDPVTGPSFGIVSAEFRVAFEIDVTLKALAERKDVAELRPDAEHLRLEASNAIARAAVAANFFVRVPHQSHLPVSGLK